MKLKKPMSLVALSTMLALTACGGPAGIEGDASKATLTIGVGTISSTLDPDQAFSRPQIGILGLTGGTLTATGRDGKQIQMRLADSVTEGDKNYVVKLKPGLEFSDGSPLRAKDVVATFKHYIANKASIVAYQYASIEKVTAVDDLTVKFDLKAPDTALPFYLAQPYSPILPANAIEARGQDLYKGDPLPSAGQFEVASFEADQVTLRANSHYAGPEASTKTVIFKKIADPAARVAQVQGGAIDFADDIPPKSAEQIVAPAEVRKAIGVNGLQMLLPNNRVNSLLSDVRIRKAIAVAIDRDQINKVTWLGLNTPTRGLFASGSQYSHPFLPEQSDVGQAKELLTGTKCANGCQLRLIVSADNPPRNDIAVVVQQNLKAIGIAVLINQAQTSAVQQQASEGNFDLLVGNDYDIADYPTGILSDLFGPAMNGFYTGYSNPEMARLLEQVRATSGSAQREWVNQVDAQFEKDLPMVPIADSFIVSASRVSSDKFDIDPTFSYHVG